MPKENTDDIVTKGFRVEVSWENDRHVQVATTSSTSKFVLPGDNPGDPEYPFHGWHVTLDRHGINRLIRTLRRARDAAFGKDE